MGRHARLCRSPPACRRPLDAAEVGTEHSQCLLSASLVIRHPSVGGGVLIEAPPAHEELVGNSSWKDWTCASLDCWKHGHAVVKTPESRFSASDLGFTILAV